MKRSTTIKVSHPIIPMLCLGFVLTSCSASNLFAPMPTQTPLVAVQLLPNGTRVGLDISSNAPQATEVPPSATPVLPSATATAPLPTVALILQGATPIVQVAAPVTQAATATAEVIQPLPTLAAQCVVKNSEGLNLRSGPGTNYPPLLLLADEQTIRPIGRTEDSEWIAAVTRNNLQGWVSAQFVSCNVPLSTLSVLNAPAPPTAAASVATIAAPVLPSTTPLPSTNAPAPTAVPPTPVPPTAVPPTPVPPTAPPVTVPPATAVPATPAPTRVAPTATLQQTSAATVPAPSATSPVLVTGTPQPAASPAPSPQPTKAAQP